MLHLLSEGVWHCVSGELGLGLFIAENDGIQIVVSKRERCQNALYIYHVSLKKEGKND